MFGEVLTRECRFKSQHKYKSKESGPFVDEYERKCTYDNQIASLTNCSKLLEFMTIVGNKYKLIKK